MTFTQHVEDCTDNHADCTVIWCDTDTPILHHETGETLHEAGAILWHSHMAADVHAEHRINPDHPALDHRGDGQPTPVTWTEPCNACRPLMTGGG